MTETSQRIACGFFAAVLLLSVAGVAAQAAYDHLPKPPLVKREARVAFTAKPPKQEATIAAVQVIAATPIPTPEPTPEPTPVATPVPTVVYVAPVVVPVATGSHTDWMATAGIAASDYPYVEFIMMKESGGNPNAVNASSGACGLLQQLSCGKWAHKWNDPVGALIDGSQYAQERYGSWSGAYSFWVSHRYW